MIEVKSIAEQLTHIYLAYEDWHKVKMSYDEALKYHQKLLEKGNIIYYEELGEVLGYVEFWILNDAQWERIKRDEIISAYQEDVSKGRICFVANLWIHPRKRKTGVIVMLQLMLYMHITNVPYIGGQHKKDGKLKLFLRRNHG